MALRKSLQLGFVALTLLASGPALAGADGRSETTAPSACAPEGERLKTLRTTPAADDAGRSIIWTAHGPEDGDRLVATLQIEGACANAVSGYLMGQGALRSGEGFSIDEAGQIVPRPGDNGLATPAVLALPAPVMADASFVGASTVDTRRIGDRLAADYIGLWTGARGSIVASFSQDDQGSGDVKVLFRSALPLQSALYFPAPDSASGRIDLVQQLGDKTRLISFDWYHRGWFASR